MGMELFWTVAGGVASVVALWIAAYQIGKRSRKGPPEPGSWKAPAIAQFERLLRACIERDSGDVDILGYSVHAIDDLTMPLVRHALEAQRAVRVLVLASSSDGFHEKSAMEASTQKLDVRRFRERTKQNTEGEYAHLLSLRQQVMYQKGLASVDLKIRAYNQFPCFRGVHVHDQGLVIGSYLLDCQKPGRELPHLLLMAPTDDLKNNHSARMFTEWFAYLWEHRSRPYSIECVVFDFYDTLVRVREEARTRTRQKMAGMLEIPRERLDTLWNDTTAASNRGQISSTKERFAFIMGQCGATVNDELASELARMEEHLLRTELEPTRDLEEVLRSLKRKGFRLALMSNCSSSAMHALSSMNLFGFFDVIHLSFQTGLLKPEPASYDALLTSLRLPSEVCVFVGDGGNNELSGAKKAGMHTVKLGWSTSPGPEASADREISSLAEMQEWLLTFDTRSLIAHTSRAAS